jgi:hypothetical protein
MTARAWLLLTADQDTAADLWDQLQDFQGMSFIEQVQGPFDLIAAIERSDLDELAGSVDTIRQMPGVSAVSVCQPIAQADEPFTGADPGWP